MFGASPELASVMEFGLYATRWEIRNDVSKMHDVVYRSEPKLGCHIVTARFTYRLRIFQILSYILAI